jgi:peptide/nickel transport system permease protein
MALLVFAYWWPILPAGHMVDPVLHDYMSGWDAFVDRLRHLVLPAASLTLLTMAGISRYQRAAMLEVLPSDFIRTARAKGLPENRVIYRHALRNAINPLITLFGFEFSSLLSGAALLEIIINWPGLGNLMLAAVRSQDTFLVMGSMLMGGVMLIIGNMIADILLVIVDPRVRG